MKLMDILNINDVVPLIEGKKVVFVTGVTGQDGSHMADYLLTNTDYFIVGGARRLSIKNHENIKHLEHTPRFKLVNFDLSDAHSATPTRPRQPARPDVCGVRRRLRGDQPIDRRRLEAVA